MRGHTKMLLTNSAAVEVTVRHGKETHSFWGKAKAASSLFKYLDEHHFEEKKEKSVPWSEVFSRTFGTVSQASVVLRAARKRAGLTQTLLAQKIKVTQPDVANMEKGKRPIGKAMAKKIAKILKVDYRILL